MEGVSALNSCMVHAITCPFGHPFGTRPSSYPLQAIIMRLRDTLVAEMPGAQ